MIVAKFGGTSVANADALRRVDLIVNSLQDEPGGVVVVLSATSGTTSQLLDIIRKAGAGTTYRSVLDELITRHEHLAEELIGSSTCIHDLTQLCREFADAVAELGEWNDATLDAFVSFGELLSTTIYDAFRKSCGATSHLQDARSLIVTDDCHQQAAVNHAITQQHCASVLKPLLTTGSVIVTQGYIASSHAGHTTTLGRGGSDYSAAIIGACLNASAIRIYTDVSGVYTCDPRMVQNARPLASVAFNEMREMASYGAKVLHPDTIEPAIVASVPVYVLNTFRPEDPGTRITDEVSDTTEIRAVSLLQNVMMLTADDERGNMLLQHEVIQRHRVLTIASATSSNICVHASNEHVAEILESIAHAHEVRVLGTSIIAVTGQGMTSAAVIGSISTQIENVAADVHIATVSSTCAVVIVSADVAVSCVQSLHELVIRRPDQAE